MGNSQYSQTFTEPIHLRQYYMTEEIFELALNNLETDEEMGQFFQILSTWALENVIDEEYAKQCSPTVINTVNDAIGMMFSGINKYRWDVFNGQKGGRPKRTVPRINILGQE